MEEELYTEAIDVDYVIIFITASGKEEGSKIAASLVEKKMVACVNMIEGITSVFRWKGKVEEEVECLLIAKTRAERIPEIIKDVKINHSYDVPEIVAFPIVDGNPSYLKWIEEVT